jgi:hypothetical protein
MILALPVERDIVPAGETSPRRHYHAEYLTTYGSYDFSGNSHYHTWLYRHTADTSPPETLLTIARPHISTDINLPTYEIGSPYREGHLTP